MKLIVRSLLAVLLSGVTTHAAVEFDWAYVGDAGNAADTSGYGAVAYDYRIATKEVNLFQYTEFLNAVAKTDLYGLYNTNMGSNTAIAGISQSGSSGSYVYSVVGSGARPVTYVSSYDAMRFTNWLNNGQGTGSTETGAYTISTGSITQRARTSNVVRLTTSSAHTLSVGDQVTVSSMASGFNGTFVVTAVTATTFSYASVGPNVSATASAGSLTGASATHAGNAGYWIPTENEWYKAAYYQPVGAGGPSDSYWLYPTASDSVPAGNTIGVADSGNFQYNGIYARDQNGLPTYLTDGGAYGINSASYYGTFDQGGNVYEWNEAIGSIGSTTARGKRGGSWFEGESYLRSSSRALSTPTDEYVESGFRVSSVPEPTTGILIILGGAALLARRGRRNTP